MTEQPHAATESPETILRELPVTSGAEKIVLVNTYWAAGAGLLPLPLLDFAAVTTVNLKMLRELAQYYDVQFRTGVVRSLLAALSAGVGTPLLSFGPVGYALKHMPVVGQTAGIIAGPIVAGSLTYAVGKVFILHFATGGSFLDFDPERYHDYFNAQLTEGRKVAETAGKRP